MTKKEATTVKFDGDSVGVQALFVPSLGSPDLKAPACVLLPSDRCMSENKVEQLRDEGSRMQVVAAGAIAGLVSRYDYALAACTLSLAFFPSQSLTEQSAPDSA